MRKHIFFGQKKPAQAMVEFAIALPVLLLLLYGILEAGRLLFIYSTVVTASRQAARYGTTTGDGGGATPVYGAPRATVPRYRDCAGIRASGNAVGYLTPGGFDIQLAYDKGPGYTPTPYCTGGTDTEISGTPTELDLNGNSTRLVVTVSTEFIPIVPKLVPFVRRTITATSARTILYSVAVVVEQTPILVSQSATTTTITTSPNPSSVDATVTITVTVSDQDDPSNIPQGTVEVNMPGGTPNSCNITLNVNTGTGTCTVSYASSGDFGIDAVYTPNDDDHISSPGTATHKVTLPPTLTEIIAVSPEPSLKNQNVMVAVRVTGGSTTPTGTVQVDAGGGGANCSIPLAGGAGSCTINFNNVGWKTINATYTGDAKHQGSTAFPVSHQVMDVTPTPTSTATTPLNTPTPTPTPPPTAIPTRVTSCTGITHGPIEISGNQLIMTIKNPWTFTLMMKDVTVTWNDDKGHETGTDKRLILQAASVNGTPIWTGEIGKQSTYTISSSATFSPGTSTITFTFNQTYDIMDSTERIYINFQTPGCEGNPLDSQVP